MKYVFFYTLIFLVFESFADCDPKKPLRVELINSDLVFVGIPISKERIVYFDSLNCKCFKLDSAFCKRILYKYQFVISEFFKGKVINDTITLYSNPSGGENGFDFQIGIKYIVYCNLHKLYFNHSKSLIFNQDVVLTSCCTRTCVFNTREYKRLIFFSKRKM